MLASFRPLLKLWPSTYIAGAVVLLSMLLPLPANGMIFNIKSLCAFHSAFGIPCPGCGLTRSFVSLGHGQLQESFRWHPLGPFLFALTVIYFFVSLRAAKKQRTFHFGSPIHIGAMISLAVVMLGFWVLRLNGIFPLPAS